MEDREAYIGSNAKKYLKKIFRMTYWVFVRPRNFDTNNCMKREINTYSQFIVQVTFLSDS